MAIHTPPIPLAGIVIDLASGIAGTTILFTGLAAAMLRSLAVLGRSSPTRVEWFTAVGFLSGAGFAAFLLVLDMVMR